MKEDFTKYTLLELFQAIQITDGVCDVYLAHSLGVKNLRSKIIDEIKSRV